MSNEVLFFKFLSLDNEKDQKNQISDLNITDKKDRFSFETSFISKQNRKPKVLLEDIFILFNEAFSLSLQAMDEIEENGKIQSVGFSVSPDFYKTVFSQGIIKIIANDAGFDIKEKEQRSVLKDDKRKIFISYKDGFFVFSNYIGEAFLIVKASDFKNRTNIGLSSLLFLLSFFTDKKETCRIIQHEFRVIFQRSILDLLKIRDQSEMIEPVDNP